MRIGASAGLTLLYTGGIGSCAGKKFCAALMAACTSCSATSMLRLRLNCSVMTDAPSALVESIWLKPGTSPSWRSSGAVMAVATTSAFAPG